MRKIAIPTAVRTELREPAAEGLNEMLADAYTIANESFERRLAEEAGKLRLDIAELRHELLKWSFLFWIGQVAAVAGVVSLLLRVR